MVLVRLLPLSSSCILLGWFGLLSPASSDDAQPAKALTYRHVINESGEAWTEDSFTGPLTIINFWATWCPPCLKEMPMLEAFHREHAQQGVRIVGLTPLETRGRERSEEDALAEIRKMIERFGVTYTNLVVADANAWDDYQASGVPVTILIDRQGMIVTTEKGIKGTKRVLKQAKRLLSTR